MDMEINGVTLQADFMDADFMEAFEPAIDRLRQEMGRMGKQGTGKSVAAGYRELNETVEGFFDDVWEPGTSGRIFGGSRNVMVHLEAVARINDAYQAERKQFREFSGRYAQGMQGGSGPVQGYGRKHNRKGGPA